MTWKVGDRVVINTNRLSECRGVITRRTWENGSYGRCACGEEIIVRHQNITRDKGGEG